MKTLNMKGGAQALTGAVVALMSAASSADLGHAVPSGVSQHSHLHITEKFIISPSWLVGTGIVVAVVVAMIVQHRRARANKG